MENKVTLIGNVGNEPIVKQFENGDKVASFSLATSETWRNKEGEKQTKTEWHNISVFGKLADVVEMWVNKGQLIYLVGKLSTRSYEKDGVKRYVTEVVLNNFSHTLKMLGKIESTQAEATENKQQQSLDEAQEQDLPF